MKKECKLRICVQQHLLKWKKKKEKAVALLLLLHVKSEQLGLNYLCAELLKVNQINTWER